MYLTLELTRVHISFIITSNIIYTGNPVVYPDPCPVGYYCPEGTGPKWSFPCPEGTYMPNERAAELDDCKNCDPGDYCGDVGLNATSGECEAGYYCTRASFSATPRNDSVSQT